MTAAVFLLSSAFMGTPSSGDAAASQADSVNQAEAAFREGVKARQDLASSRRWFREAATHYETIRRQGVSNADLDRNLGNAYLLAGNLPRAILAYRRGLLVNPGDDALRANLAYAREHVVYPEPGSHGRPAGDPWTHWLSRRAAGLDLFAALAFYALGWLGITRWWMARQTWPLGAGLAAFTLAGVVAAGRAMNEWDQGQNLNHPIVVVAADGVYLRRGNGYAYPRRFDSPLNRGVEARLLFRRGEWLQVDLGGGEIGWLPSSKVLLEDPSTNGLQNCDGILWRAEPRAATIRF